MGTEVTVKVIIHGYYVEFTVSICLLVCVLIKYDCTSSAVWLEFPVLQVSQLNTPSVCAHVLSVYDVPKLSDTTHNTHPLSSSPPL